MPSFAYSDLAISKAQAAPQEEITVSCTITNTGRHHGTEVVQMYLRDEYAAMVRPVQELVGFCRVTLMPGEKKRVHFTFRPDRMAYLNRDMQWQAERGEIKVRIGASSEDIRLEGAFRIEETALIEGNTRCFFAKAELAQA